ncbi:tetratricopeptide repeat protein 28-like [Stylophora pistillata]|uniref:tetratricopeptide repeat protein 28-like n=1 Tax=Stylophora pistillata TaxID=50429 RepID=UPI000C03B010|nr:tetratricopeptide repeat protein 28-like [Stylophora pistillata]
MDNEEGLMVSAIVFGVVAYLLNTGRGLQAMKLGKECLIFLTSKARIKEYHWFYGAINLLMFDAAYKVSNYTSAERYAKELLIIYHASSDTLKEGRLSLVLGQIYQKQNEFEKAREYYQKAADITRSTGDKQTEERCYIMIGNLFNSLCEYHKAEEYYKKALTITVSNGERDREATIYGNLALAVRKEIGDREGEAADYGNLGTLFHSLGDYKKAQEYTEKALAIRKQIGDRKGEATGYGNLGTLFQSFGEYKKAQEYTEKALAIRKEIGDREGEAADYGNLGTLFQSLGEYRKAQAYTENSLLIRVEIGDRKGEAADYGNLGALFHSLGEYRKAQTYTENALLIREEIGDRGGEAADYGNLGALFHSLGEYTKAKDFTEKGLAITKEIGDKKGEAALYGNLGALFHSLGELEKAEFYFREALLKCKGIGDSMTEFKVVCGLTVLELAQFNLEEAFSYLFQSIAKFEKLRNFVKGNDYFQISLLENYGVFPYDMLIKLLSFSGNFTHALYVEELRRARALADLMTSQYSAKEFQFSGDPRSWCGIHHIMKGEGICSGLYLSVDDEDARIWILKTSGEIHFRRKRLDSDRQFGNAGSVPDLKVFFSESFLHFGILPRDVCEDRSLNDERVPTSSDDVNRSPSTHNNMKKNLRLCYEIIVAPVADLLKEPEIIIVPDSCMYQVPFAALIDEGGRYLSETFKIRIAPSLTTLKLIKDSPPNYHSQSGALIVGEPEVSKVIYKGQPIFLEPLPGARREAEMIGKMLGVPPLLGRHATKKAVIEQMKSVALIHFAAHGYAERGEIALCPVSTTNNIPQEEEYLLTMADVSKVQLRAKLVVLSCCHSGRGETKVEGVIGIARAFLGSGARSVLVARWALNDESTEQFMNRFYEFLFRGESASESLHEVRKWMRNNGFPEVEKWAPFMLIGDNVTLRKEDITSNAHN